MSILWKLRFVLITSHLREHYFMQGVVSLPNQRLGGSFSLSERAAHEARSRLRPRATKLVVECPDTVRPVRIRRHFNWKPTCTHEQFSVTSGRSHERERASCA